MTGQEYTAFGEPTVMTRQIAGGALVESDNDYDPVDRRLVRQVVQPETGPGTIVDRYYERDPAGNIVAVRDVPEVGGHETQCFRYDMQRRLIAAWTPRAGCEAAPSVAELGGPAPYWLEWTIDEVGNRTSETEHTAAGDIVRSYATPGSGLGNSQPHTLTAVTTSAPGQEEVTTRYAYDSVGNTVCRPAGAAANSCDDGAGSQALTWDPEGRLATVAVGGEVVQTNIYDAGGTRLIRRDSTGTTLYLPGMELRREAGTVTATRYYTFGAGPIAVRTPAGLSWLFSDHQGTQDVSVDAVTQQVTYRRQTPYGGRRGDAVAWPTTKGFVGGTNEPTGLVHIGARPYDPDTGRFLSVDPVMDLTDAQQIHGYAYSNNSPVTFSDPTGLRACIDNDCRATLIPRPGGEKPRIQDTRYHPSKPQSRGGPGPSPRAQELLSVPILGRPLTEREYWEWRYMYGCKGSTAFTLGDVMAHAECQQRGACLEGVRGGKWFLQAVCEAMGGRPKECWIPSEGAEKFDEIVLAGLGAAPNAYISIPATILSIIFDINDGEYQSAAEDAAGLANDVKIKGIKDVGAPIGTMIAQGIEDPEKVTQMLRPGTVIYGTARGSTQCAPPNSPAEADGWRAWTVMFPMPASFFEIQKSDATLFNDLVQIGMLSPPERLQ